MDEQPSPFSELVLLAAYLVESSATSPVHSHPKACEREADCVGRRIDAAAAQCGPRGLVGGVTALGPPLDEERYARHPI